jgi:hypothetical protein
MNPQSERRFPRLPLAKAEAGASPGAAAFLEDLIGETSRSLINGLLRVGSLEKEGQDWI